MITLQEKITCTILIGIPLLLVLWSRRLDSVALPSILMAGVDWKMIRLWLFRPDGRWRPIAKAVLLAALVAALVCVWLA